MYGDFSDYYGGGLYGLGLVATDLFTAPEIAFLQKVWPTIRVAARWTDPNWGSIGYPNGPPVSSLTDAIMNAAWSDIRRAAQFSDINWDAVPELSQAMIYGAQQILHPPPAAAPVPEVVASPPTASSEPAATATVPTMRTPEQSPTAQPVNVDTAPAAAPVPEAQQATTPYVDVPSTPVNAPSGSGVPSTASPYFDWSTLFSAAGGQPLVDASGTPLPPTSAAAPKQAGMFGAYTNVAYVGLAIAAALIFGTHGKKGRGKKRRRA